MQRRITQELSDIIRRENGEITNTRGIKPLSPIPKANAMGNQNYVPEDPEPEDRFVISHTRPRGPAASWNQTPEVRSNNSKSKLFRNPNWAPKASANEFDPLEDEETLGTNSTESYDDILEDDEDADAYELEQESAVVVPRNKLRNASSHNLVPRKYSAATASPNVHRKISRTISSKEKLRRNEAGTSGNDTRGESSANRYPRGSSQRMSASREVVPLQVEFSESVCDKDGLRRYLSRSETLDSGVGEASFNKSSVSSRSTTRSSLHPNTLNLLVTRRTMALSQAIMTLALLAASCSQLRFIVAYAGILTYPGLNYFLVCSCIFFEILVGIGYVILARFSFSEEVLEKLHSYLIFALFYIAIAIVILSAFALENHVCELAIARKKARNNENEFDTIDQPPPHVNIQPMQMIPNSQQYQQQELVGNI